jgi:hypothetical protein
VSVTLRKHSLPTNSTARITPGGGLWLGNFTPTCSRSRIRCAKTDSLNQAICERTRGQLKHEDRNIRKAEGAGSVSPNYPNAFSYEKVKRLHRKKLSLRHITSHSMHPHELRCQMINCNVPSKTIVQTKYTNYNRWSMRGLQHQQSFNRRSAVPVPSSILIAREPQHPWEFAKQCSRSIPDSLESWSDAETKYCKRESLSRHIWPTKFFSPKNAKKRVA